MREAPKIERRSPSIFARNSEALAMIHRRAFRSERPWTAPEFEALRAKPGVVVLGDERSFILGRIILDEAEVLTVATDPDHQRKGLAGHALSAFCGLARDQGAATVFLDVAADNAAAMALYTRAGFAQAGRRTAYYARTSGPPVDAILLRLALTQSHGPGAA